MENNEVFSNLVGRKILGIYVSKGEHFLKFETDDGAIYYKAVGDCCSETWFAEILGFDNLIGEVVESCVYSNRIINKDDGKTRQEYDRFYGFELITKKGMCLFVYRNSSNGYYGGWAERELCPNINLKFRKIEDDWEV